MARSNHLANFAICYVRRVSAALFGSDANQFSSKLGLGSDWSNLGHKPGQFGTGTNWFDSDGTLADYPASGRVSQGGQVRYLPYFVRLLDTIYITFRNTTFRVSTHGTPSHTFQSRHTQPITSPCTEQEGSERCIPRNDVDYT